MRPDTSPGWSSARSQVAVLAPDLVEWIRAAAPGLEVEGELRAARVSVTSAELAGRALEAAPGAPVVVVGEPGRVDDPRIAHVIRPEIAPAHLAALLGALSGHLPAAPAFSRPDPSTAAGAHDGQRAFAASRQLAAAATLADAE